AQGCLRTAVIGEKIQAAVVTAADRVTPSQHRLSGYLQLRLPVLAGRELIPGSHPLPRLKAHLLRTLDLIAAITWPRLGRGERQSGQKSRHQRVSYPGSKPIEHGFWQGNDTPSHCPARR